MAATGSFPKAEITQLLTHRDIKMSRVLLLAEVGSTAHGLSASDTGDDLDATVVRIETFPELITGDPARQSLMVRTQPDGYPSRMGDIDLNVYTLRKFVALARKGNPSILAAIFSPLRHMNTLGENWTTIAEKVASRHAGHAFLGYLHQQIDRWQNPRHAPGTTIKAQGVTRQDLIDRYGFDTKYAAHAIRLGYQGIEYLQTGRFTMPMEPAIAERLIDLRRGGLTEPQALKWAGDVEGILEAAFLSSRLPDEPAPTNEWLNGFYASLARPT